MLIKGKAKTSILRAGIVLISFNTYLPIGVAKIKTKIVLAIPSENEIMSDFFNARFTLNLLPLINSSEIILITAVETPAVAKVEAITYIESIS